MNTNRKEQPTQRTRRQSTIRPQEKRFASLSGSARRWIDIEDYDADPANDTTAEEQPVEFQRARGLVFRIPDTF